MSDQNQQNNPAASPDQPQAVTAPVAAISDQPVPQLTLDGADIPAAPAARIKPIEQLSDRVQLTPEEQRQVDDLASQIDLHNTNIIVQFGSGAQKKMTGFSESALASVRSKDLGEVGAMLSGLVTQLKSVSVEETNTGIFGGFFKKANNKVVEMKARYASAEKNVGQIVSALEAHQITLLKDIEMLDKMYQQNLVYFKELSMYIMAGKKKLAEVENTELPVLREKARASGLPEDAQAVNDLANLCDRFSKKLYDLDLTRTISIQMAPQIRLVQNNDTLMSEKIQSTLVNTIPLWKSQMVLALGVAHSQQAAQAQRDVSEMTNQMLRQNSETLKTASIETAKESERGIVELETLQKTNADLIITLDEVLRIQTEGRQKRGEAEIELARIEGELKQKMLELRE